MGENVTKGDLKVSQLCCAGVLVLVQQVGLLDLARNVSHSEESVERLEGEEGKKISMGVE